MKKALEDLKIQNELICAIPQSKSTPDLLKEKNRVFEVLRCGESKIEKSGDFLKKHLGHYKHDPQVPEHEYEKIILELENLRNDAIRDGSLIYDKNGNFQYAIAPNGEQSRLNEIDFLTVRTENFKKFFGDWQDDNNMNRSKVLDENREPKIVYHGTRFDFGEFDPNKSGKGSGNNENTENCFYFIEYEKAAEEFMGTIFRYPNDSKGDNRHAYAMLKKSKNLYNDFVEEFGKNAVDKVFDTFENNKNQRSMYYPTGKVEPFYLNIRVPNEVALDDFNITWHNGTEFKKLLTGDGIIANAKESGEEIFNRLMKKYKENPNGMFSFKPTKVEDYMEEHSSSTYVAYEPNQIKSTKNILFDIDSNNFNY